MPSSVSGRNWGPQSAAEDGDCTRATSTFRAALSIRITGAIRPSFEVRTRISAKMWTADKFDPDRLMELYKKAGAKYFMSMASPRQLRPLGFEVPARWNARSPWAEEGHRRLGRGGAEAGLAVRGERAPGIQLSLVDGLLTAATRAGDGRRPLRRSDPQYADLYHEYTKEFLIPEPGGPRSWQPSRSPSRGSNITSPHQGFDRQV